MSMEKAETQLVQEIAERVADKACNRLADQIGKRLFGFEKHMAEFEISISEQVTLAVDARTVAGMQELSEQFDKLTTDVSKWRAQAGRLEKFCAPLSKCCNSEIVTIQVDKFRGRSCSECGTPDMG